MTPRSTGVGARPKCLRSHPSVLETNEHSPADARSILAPLPQHTFPCCSKGTPVVLLDVEHHLKRTDPPLRVQMTETWQTTQRNVLEKSWFNSSRLQTSSYKNAPHVRDDTETQEHIHMKWQCDCLAGQRNRAAITSSFVKCQRTTRKTRSLFKRTTQRNTQLLTDNHKFTAVGQLPSHFLNLHVKLTTKPFVTATTGRVVTPRSTGVGARPKYLRSHPSVLETSEHSPADARSILAPLPQHTFPCCSNVLLLFSWDVEKTPETNRPSSPCAHDRAMANKTTITCCRNHGSTRRDCQTPSYNNAPHIRDDNVPHTETQ